MRVQNRKRTSVRFAIVVAATIGVAIVADVVNVVVVIIGVRGRGCGGTLFA